MIEIIQFPCLNDNYGFILYDNISHKTVCIDTPSGDEIIKQAKSRGLEIDEIWNTHWHPDHAGFNKQICDEFGAIVIGPNEVQTHGFLLHKTIMPNDEFEFGGTKIKIIDLSGHTLGQIGYYIESQNIFFVGDALFVLGCGRLFEGDAKLAFDNLENLKKFPKETTIYCAHEYSLANAKFCASLNLSNQKLLARIKQIEDLRAKNIPTVPTNLQIEMETNPFLLADYENLKIDLGLQDLNQNEVFAHIRKAKDNF